MDFEHNVATFQWNKFKFVLIQYHPVDALIALMMEAARTSETSVDIQLRTEDSELHI
jgi:hypothetical protein